MELDSGGRCAALKSVEHSGAVRTSESGATLRCAANCPISRVPNGILQVYVIIIATLLTIPICETALTTAPAQSPATGSDDHLGTNQLQYFFPSASSQKHLQHFENVSAEEGKVAAGEEEEEGQREPLVVKNDRRDPLHHLAKYKGGYDLKSKHYWASTWFTGISGYTLGTLWLLGGILGVIALYRRYSRIRRKNSPLQPFYKLPIPSMHLSKIKLGPIISATIFTSLIICACGVACVGSQKFHSMAKKVETTLIVQGANNATRLIRVVTQVMGQMKLDLEPYDQGVAQKLNNTTFKLNNASISLINVVHDHKSSLDAILLGLNVGIITLAIINIALWTIGLACLYIFPRLIWAFSLVFALLWLLVFLNWVTFGITFSLSNFADDTCKAMKEYQESPNDTTLDNVLPCHKLAGEKNTILRFRQKIYNYIEVANKYISERNLKETQANKENTTVATIDLPQVCNPFLGPPLYPPNNSCKDGTLPISSLPELLSSFKCPSNKTRKTKNLECISTSQYNIASAYISATQKLLSSLPDVDNLTGCSFLVDTFTIIVQKECKPLKQSIRMVWIVMVLLSTITTLAILLWLWLISKVKFPSLKWGGTILPHDHSPLPP